MSQQPAPLISIIVAVFNGAKTLQQCIDSVTQQTYPNKELIVIDGGSTDGTVDLLKANHSQISYWISEPDHGIYSAWNKGLEQASGEWICFLGADDFFWDIQSLELMAKKLQTLPHYIRVAYGQVMLLGKDDENLYQVGDPWESVKDRFKQIMCIPHQGVMHRSSLFEQYGNFDESFRISGDYELLLRELKAADAVFIPNLIVAGMRQGGISSNPTASLTLLHEIRRAQREHDIFLPGHVWLTVTARVYLRLLLWRLLGEQRSRQALDLARRVMGLHPFWTKT